MVLVTCGPPVTKDASLREKTRLWDTKLLRSAPGHKPDDSQHSWTKGRPPGATTTSLRELISGRSGTQMLPAHNPLRDNLPVVDAGGPSIPVTPRSYIRRSVTWTLQDFDRFGTRRRCPSNAETRGVDVQISLPEPTGPIS